VWILGNDDLERPLIITVTRTYKDLSPILGNGLFGNLVIDTGPFHCLTLERAGVEILAGTYPIKWMRSQHFDQIMPFIVVPGRVACEQHWANWPNQLEGCQALGFAEDLKGDMLQQSKNAWNAYIDVILNQPNLMLKIVDDYGV
jgi:hypothetical protein